MFEFETVVALIGVGSVLTGIVISTIKIVWEIAKFRTDIATKYDRLDLRIEKIEKRLTLTIGEQQQVKAHIAECRGRRTHKPQS